MQLFLGKHFNFRPLSFVSTIIRSRLRALSPALEAGTLRMWYWIRDVIGPTTRGR